jgi:predicted nicotinamide N-methyase
MPVPAAALTCLVRDGTRLGAPPYVPEVRLYLAEEVFGLWERSGALPYWAFAWAGGLGLARHVLDHPGIVRGRTVLDVASGSGLVAIAAALAGAAQVTASDVDPAAVAAIALNAAANGVAVRVAGDVLDGCGEGAQVVLAGDVFYEAPMAARVRPFLERAAGRGADVLVGDPGRAYLPGTGLTRVAAYRVPVLAVLEDAGTKQVTVWRVGG